MKEKINPEELFDSSQFGFSQISVSSPGKFVFISGQVAWDENQNLIGEDDLALQTAKSLDNLEIAVKAADGTLEDIVMLRIYKVNYKPEDGIIISRMIKQKFGNLAPPASTWIGVNGLANQGFLIEIEAQAII